MYEHSKMKWLCQNYNGRVEINCVATVYAMAGLPFFLFSSFCVVGRLLSSHFLLFTVPLSSITEMKSINVYINVYIQYRCSELTELFLLRVQNYEMVCHCMLDTLLLLKTLFNLWPLTQCEMTVTMLSFLLIYSFFFIYYCRFMSFGFFLCLLVV